MPRGLGGNKYQARVGPSRVTIGILVVFLALTPIFIISVLVLNLQSPLQSLAPHPSPSHSPAAPTSRGSSNSGTNGSALCANATKYQGLDATDPSHTNVSLSFPIFSMKPGSSAEMCISFYNHDNLKPVTLNLGDMVTIGNYEASVLPNGTSVLKFVPVGSNLTITPAQPSLVLSGGNTANAPGSSGGTLAPNQAVVAFRINATASSKGTYFINIEGISPVACQGDFRLAIGLKFTQSNASGPFFTLPPHVGACSAGTGVVHDHVYGVLGMDVSYVNCGLFICDVNRPPG